MLDKLAQFISSVRAIYLNAVADDSTPYNEEVPSPKELAEQFELINNFENITVLGEEASPIVERRLDKRVEYTLYPTVMIQIDNVEQGSTRKTNLGTYYLGLYCTGWAGFSFQFYVKHKDWLTAYTQEEVQREPFNTLEEGHAYAFAYHPHIQNGNACMGNFEAPIKSALNSLNFIGGIAQIKHYINSWNVNSQFTRLTYFKPKVRYKLNIPIHRLNNEEKIKYINRLSELDTFNPRSSYLELFKYAEYDKDEYESYVYPESHASDYARYKWKDVDEVLGFLPDKEEKKAGDNFIRTIEVSTKVPEPKISLSQPYNRGASHIYEWSVAILDLMVRYNVSEEDAMEIMRVRLYKRNIENSNEALCNFLATDKKAAELRKAFRVIKNNYHDNVGYSRGTFIGIDSIDSPTVLNNIKPLNTEEFNWSLKKLLRIFERRWISISKSNDNKRIYWVYQDATNTVVESTEGLYRTRMIENRFAEPSLDKLLSKPSLEVNEEKVIEEMTQTIDRMHKGLNLLLVHQCEENIKLLNKERNKHETKLKNLRESIPANQLAFGPLFEGRVERSSVLQEDRTE